MSAIDEENTFILRREFCRNWSLFSISSIILTFSSRCLVLYFNVSVVSSNVDSAFIANELRIEVNEGSSYAHKNIQIFFKYKRTKGLTMLTEIYIYFSWDNSIKIKDFEILFQLFLCSLIQILVFVTNNNNNFLLTINMVFLV